MTTPRLSLRIDLPNGQRLGPGKAALLAAIDKTETIRSAAETLSMSYPRALKLIEQMNTSFSAPLIETQHGGIQRGGARLTVMGRRVLDLYNEICAASDAAAKPAFEQLKAQIKK